MFCIALLNYAMQLVYDMLYIMYIHIITWKAHLLTKLFCRNSINKWEKTLYCFLLQKKNFLIFLPLRNKYTLQKNNRNAFFLLIFSFAILTLCTSIFFFRFLLLIKIIIIKASRHWNYFNRQINHLIFNTFSLVYL